jgi:hypothetical protein
LWTSFEKTVNHAAAALEAEVEFFIFMNTNGLQLMLFMN